MSDPVPVQTQWKVLGPLEVYYGESLVVVRGRHHPKVLAVLLTEAGQVVPADAIVGALWDTDPPGTAHRQVSNIVGALRRQLGPVGRAISTVGNGYRITVAGSSLDLDRFRQAVAITRRERRAGRLPEALDAARIGLDQWRGPALAGLDGRIIGGIARRLDNARRELLAERLDLEIALGAHREVIGELAELVTADPTRQRFVEQLMLALSRDGRTPEAIEVYRRTRDRLVEELGIDPGRRLQELHTTLLRDEPRHRSTTGTGRPRPAVPAPVVPAQLPAGTAMFVGRESELAQLDDAVAHHPVVVSGAGGTGKTALVLHWAHRDPTRFPDGRLYVNLRGFDRREPVPPVVALRFLLRSLGLPAERIPDDEAMASAELRSQLAGRNMLMVLDNARDVSQVRPLLPGTRDVAVVVTGRNRLAGLVALDDARPVQLSELNNAESRSLLTRLLTDARLSVSPRTVAELADLCGGLPLALRIVAADLISGRIDPERYVARLRAGRGTEATRFTMDSDSVGALVTTFTLSLDALRPADRRAVLQLARIPGDDLPDGLVDTVVGAVDGASVARLEAAHLLERHLPRRLRFHDLVREFLLHRGDIEYPEDAGIVADRVIDWYTGNRQDLTGDDLPNFLTTAEEYFPLPRSWELIAVVTVFLQYGFGEDRGAQLVRRALQRVRADDNPVGRTRLLIALGGHHWVRLDTVPAIRYGEQALAIAERLGDPAELSRTMSHLALFCYAGNRYTEAERYYRGAVELARRTDDAMSQFRGLINWAATERVRARFDEAWGLLERAAGLMPRLALSPSAGMAVSCGRANIRVEQGRLSEAMIHIDALLADAERHNAVRYTMLARQLRAEVRHRSGDPAEAVRELGRMLAAQPQAGDRQTADSWADLARAAADLGDRDLALDSLARAETVLDVLTPSRRAVVWRARAAVAVRGWIADSPVSCAQRAVELCEPLGAPMRLARALLDLERAYRCAGDTVTALSVRRRASELFVRHGARDETGSVDNVPEDVDGARAR